MEWLSKIIDVLKIPLKIILPAGWLFSGALTFLNDQILQKLGLLEWKMENSSILGLTFIISSSLIAVYICYFVIEKASELLLKLTQKRKTMKSILKMSPMEGAIIVKLYTAPGFTAELDYGHPVVQGMLARNFIYAGSQQFVSMNISTKALPTKFTLQPFVYQALDYYQQKIKRRIEKIEKRLSKEKKVMKKARLNEKLQGLQDFYETFYVATSW